MTFQELFAGLKEKFATADVSRFKDPTRIQIDLTGEAAGVFCVEVKGGSYHMEPHGDKNFDLRMIMSDKDFQKLLEKKLDPMAAWASGRMKVQGDFGAALELRKLIQ